MAKAPKSFSEPVAASRARSRAQQIIDLNRDEVEQEIINGNRQKLIRILLDAQRQIRVAQRTADPKATWTQLDLDQTMRLVDDALITASTRFKTLLVEQRREAYAVGARNTAQVLAHFEHGEDTGTVRPLAIAEAVSMRKLALHEHATSVDRYGLYMIRTIRRELQAGIVRGATFHEMTSLLVGKKGPRGPTVSLSATVGPDGKVKRLVEVRSDKGLFVERRGWAERIVRTEAMRAYAAGADEEISRQKSSFPDLKRKLIETFDARTAPDSYVAHGQVRGSTETFFDGKHTYLRPPGRPNDRAVIIPWRKAWERGGAEEGALDADELEPLQERAMGKDGQPIERPRPPPSRPTELTTVDGSGDRHYPEKIRAKSPASDRENTLVLDRDAVSGDLLAIRAGGGEMFWLSEAEKGIRINGRTYGHKGATNRLYPVDGPGLLRISQGEYLAVKNLLTKSGREADIALEKDGRISASDIERAREIIAKLPKR